MPQISPFTRLIHLYRFPISYLARVPLLSRAKSGYGDGHERGYSSRVAPLRERLAILSIEQVDQGCPLGLDEEPQVPEPVGPFERALRESLDPLAAPGHHRGR